MSTTLTTVRYYTQDDAYHYTIDNRPLQDLEANDLILKNAIDDITNNTSTTITSGDWSTLTVTLDLFKDFGKPFAYIVKVWATKDQTLTSTQSTCISEDVVIGSNTLGSGIVINSITNVFNQSVGLGTLTKTFTPSGNNLVISFSGYTGVHGYVITKAERFGI